MAHLLQAGAFVAEHGFDFTSAEFAEAAPRELSTRELEAAVGGESEEPHGEKRSVQPTPDSRRR